MPSRITFRVSTGVNEGWECPIHCARCEYIKANDQQCRNRVCHGSPLCWQHNRMEWGVRARPSTIPGAGKGLFATRAFAEDEWICPMTCEQITQVCLDQRYPGDMTAPYADIDLGSGEITDCACSRGIASQANALFQPNGFVRPIGDHNAIALTGYDAQNVSMGIWVAARTNILAGAEIFLWYGTDEGPNAYRLEDTHTTRRRSFKGPKQPC